MEGHATGTRGRVGGQEPKGKARESPGESPGERQGRGEPRGEPRGQAGARERGGTDEEPGNPG